MRKKGIGILLIFAIGLSGCKTQSQVTDNATVEIDEVELIKDAGNLSRDSVLSWIRWFGLSGNDTKGFAGR